MTRLIPGKTKVQVELFHGVRLGDVIVAAFAVAMLIFVLISNLPFRYVIAGGIALIAAFLLIRIDEQPNYSFLVNIIWFLVSGMELALANFIFGCLWCVTIVGIPFGKQFFKIAKLALSPFGSSVVQS